MKIQHDDILSEMRRELEERKSTYPHLISSGYFWDRDEAASHYIAWRDLIKCIKCVLKSNPIPEVLANMRDELRNELVREIGIRYSHLAKVKRQMRVKTAVEMRQPFAQATRRHEIANFVLKIFDNHFSNQKSLF
jgi:hypothetical protein